jgi:hypothetical protein
MERQGRDRGFKTRREALAGRERHRQEIKDQSKLILPGMGFKPGLFKIKTSTAII